MIVTGMEIWPIRIPYRNPYSTALGRATHAEGIIIRLRTDQDLSGIGEASFLFPDRSGETIDTSVRVLHRSFGPRLIGKDPLDLGRILEDLDAAIGDQFSLPYSRTAIDLALHDLIGKALGVPLVRLLGGALRDRLTVGRSLAIKPLDEIVAHAQGLAAKGYKMLTLKGSRDAPADIQRFLAVRRALGDDFPLEIDPNQAYSVKAAIHVARVLEGAGLANLEQPCAWWNLAGMARVTRASSVPVTADESVMSPADVMTVARMQAADMVTIKLARVGGIVQARRMVAVAEAAGLACNMGSKHTFGVGTAAIVHFAAAHGAITEPLGYGSPLERFVDDVIVGEIPFANGIVRIPDGPGLGVVLDDAKLRKYSDQGMLEVSA
jgi:muconate cycloisomerase